MIKVIGIVTKSKEFGENKRRINIFTPNMGVLVASVYGTASTKGGKAVSVMLFSCGEYVLSLRNGYYTVSSYTPIDAFSQICHDYTRYCVGLQMLKAINSCMYTSDSDERVYELLVYSQCALNEGEINPYDVHIFFMLRLMSLVGFCPTVTTCACCGESILNCKEQLYFSIEDGGAVCPQCARDDTYAIATLSLEVMRRLLMLDYSALDRVVIPDFNRKELVRILTTYVVTYLEEPKIVRT